MLWNCAASSAKCDCCRQHPSHSHQEGSGTAAFPPTPATGSTPQQQQQQLPKHRLKARSGKTPPHPALTPLSHGQRLLCCEGAESHISQSPWEQSRAECHDSIYWNMDTIMSQESSHRDEPTGSKGQPHACPSFCCLLGHPERGTAEQSQEAGAGCSGSDAW